MLREKGISLFIYNDSKIPLTRFFANGPIMHHKFAIFDDAKLWTGSFNWTASANRCNQENVIITTERSVCLQFKNCFDQLKALCEKRSPLEIDKNLEAPSAGKVPLIETSIQMVKAAFRLPRTV